MLQRPWTGGGGVSPPLLDQTGFCSELVILEKSPDPCEANQHKSCRGLVQRASQAAREQHSPKK